MGLAGARRGCSHRKQSTPEPRDRRRDRIEKLREYAAFRVRWYWLIDPEARSLEILKLGDDGHYAPAVGTRLINFAIERQRHDGFIGRAALLARLDQLLIEERADRWVVVTGGPGMGKSALEGVEWLLEEWKPRRDLRIVLEGHAEPRVT